MTKYIRTKDGRIYDLQSKEVSSWEYIDESTAINEYGVEGAFYTIYYFDENEGHYSEYDNKGGHSCDFIEEKDILKQSDTIADLCDKFVVNDLVDKVHYIKDYDDIIEDIYYGRLDFTTIVYGAIWTDKGLKYVAKMDNEGKLVLI